MTIDLNAQAERSRPLLRSIRGSASRRGKTPLARLSVRAHALSSSITVGVLRNLIAASDALRKFLADPANSTPSVAEFTQPGAVLTELLRRYQAVSRQCGREWLHGPQPIFGSSRRPPARFWTRSPNRLRMGPAPPANCI